MWEERGFDGGDVEQVISFTIVENPNITDLQHEAVKGAPFQDPEVSPDVIFTHPTIIMLVRVQKILGNSAFDKNRFETLEKSPDGSLLVGNFGVSPHLP